MSDGPPRQTPLHEAHQAASARLVDFAGWDMPVQYSGINDEHNAVRQRAGRFDVSHMGRLYVDGSGCVDWLEHVLPTRIARLRIGQMAYSILCTPEGGAVDDLAVYRLGERRFLLVVNASRADADLQALEELLPVNGTVAITNRTEDEAMIAVQGPQAADTLSTIDTITDRFGNFDDLGFFRFRASKGDKAGWLMSRSGYTGEDGFEIICPAASVGELWQALGEADVAPIGLGARDTLRTEMGYPLYGHELSLEIGPVEAGLEWALNLEQKQDFIGREALRGRRQSNQRLMGLRLTGKGIPRPGCAVLQDGINLGVVTSGTYSPSLRSGIALALVDQQVANRDAAAVIDVRGRELPARFCDLPFVPARVKRRRSRKS